MTDAHGVARDQLRAFIERIERLEEEKKTIADDIKDVYGEAKGFGYDTKAIRTIIRLRKKDANERAEEEAVLDSYMAALGMIEQHDLFDETVATPATRTHSPAMALQSPRKAAEAVSERAAFNPEAKASVDNAATIAPEMATAGREMRVGSAPSGSVPATSEGGRDSVERHAPNSEMDRATEGSFETGSEAAEKGRKATATEAAPVDLNHAGAGESPATEIASTAQGEVEAPSAERVTPQGSGSAAANAGGDHVNAQQSSAATAGALVQPAPAIKHKFRPNCQHRDHCKSGTVDHCHSCKLAMREGEAA